MPLSGADLSRDYPLTYRDPTGEQCVKNLSGATVQLTWENGTRLFFDIKDLRPLLAQCEFRASRKGLVWGTFTKEGSR